MTETAQPLDRVTVEIRYDSPYAGKVFLVWGIEGWQSIPADWWPPHSEKSANGAIRSPMIYRHDQFITWVKVPKDIRLDYGFLITETKDGKPIYQWDSVTGQDSVITVQFGAGPTVEAQTALVWRKVRRKLLETVGSLSRKPSREIKWHETPYTRFIILCHGRTGSSYLRILLSSHPNIKAYSELFHASEEQRFAQSRTVGSTIMEGDDPVAYLNKHVYRRYSGDVKAVGFKILYGHASIPNWVTTWDYLQQSGVLVIHLKRRNLLDRYLSGELAKKAQQWMVRNPEDTKEYNEPIEIDPTACIEDIKHAVEEQERYAHLFRDNPKIELVYEDLVANYEEETRRLLDFLNVEYHPLTAKSVKQRNRPKSEVIVNYEELKVAFQSGVEAGELPPEWLTYFDEN